MRARSQRGVLAAEVGVGGWTATVKALTPNPTPNPAARTVAQEETHAPAEKVTPGMHVRQLALPAPPHVRHVASHATHVEAPPPPPPSSRYLPSGHVPTHAPSSRCGVSVSGQLRQSALAGPEHERQEAAHAAQVACPSARTWFGFGFGFGLGFGFGFGSGFGFGLGLVGLPVGAHRHVEALLRARGHTRRAVQEGVRLRRAREALGAARARAGRAGGVASRARLRRAVGVFAQRRAVRLARHRPRGAHLVRLRLRLRLRLRARLRVRLRARVRGSA